MPSAGKEHDRQGSDGVVGAWASASDLVLSRGDGVGAGPAPRRWGDRRISCFARSCQAERARQPAAACRLPRPAPEDAGRPALRKPPNITATPEARAPENNQTMW